MIRSLCFSAALAASAAVVLAAEPVVTIDRAWVRATAPGQPASAGYMTLTAAKGARLVGVQTPAAAVAEVHEMKMDGDIMRMRPVPAIDLPAGRAVELKPGGLHLMLMQLNAPLPENSSVPVTLVFKDAGGNEFRQEAILPVRVSEPGK